MNWSVILYYSRSRVPCMIICFPVKPLLTEGIGNAIKTKNQPWAKWKNTHPPFWARNILNINNIVRTAEKDYYGKLLTDNKSNLMKSWKFMNPLIINKKNNFTCETFNIDNCESDKHRIAKTFNDFFVNIGSSLSGKIPPGQCDPITYVKNGNIDTIFLRPINNDEVMSILKDMRTSKSRMGWFES